MGTLRKLRKSIRIDDKPIIFIPEDYDLNLLVNDINLKEGTARLHATVVRNDNIYHRLLKEVLPAMPKESEQTKEEETCP